MIIILINAGVFRLDENKIGKGLLVLDVLIKKHLDVSIVGELLRLAQLVQDQRAGNIVVVDPPGPAGLLQPVENRVLRLLKKSLQLRILYATGHGYFAGAGAGECKEAVGPGRSGQRREPAVANRKFASQLMQRRQKTLRVIAHDLLSLCGRRIRIDALV